MKKGLFAALFTLKHYTVIPILTCYENNVNGREPLIQQQFLKEKDAAQKALRYAAFLIRTA
jgi:hypothetical protein